MEPEDDDEDDIVNPINIMKIKKKVDSNMYTSLYEFLIDFEWLAHNYEIMYTCKFHLNYFFIKIMCL